MIRTDFDSEREYSERKFNTETVHSDGNQKTMLGYFESDQFIPVHEPDSTLTILVRQGSGTVADGEEEEDIKEGDVAVVPAGTPRGIRAGESGLELLLVASPPPTDEEHAKVREGIQHGNFRPE